MVNFSVFNELSLPLSEHRAIESFGVFFGLLTELKKLGLNKIRMSNDLKSYFILENTRFQQFIGQQSDRDFKTRLKSFVNNTVIEIDTPIIKDVDLDQHDSLNCCEYLYDQEVTVGGLACCDIWNTIAISFNTNKQWNNHQVTIQKIEIINDEIIDDDVAIQHASELKHLSNHQEFFEQIALENKLSIAQDNFWQNRHKYFPNKIIFCLEVESQLEKLDKMIFQQAISILRDVEMEKKLITDFHCGLESKTVHTNPKFRKTRMFTISNQQVFFEDHIKSLPHGYRIYFLEKENKVYIGYIGKHLKNKRDH